MQSFNQETQTDLPNLRKRQTYRDKEKEADAFDLLFKNNKETDLIDLRKNKRFKGYHFYFAIGLTLLITACFLVVQVVTNSPEIEKYKAVTKNIEDVGNDNEEQVVAKNESPANTSILDVRFADSSINQVTKPVNVVKQQKQIISKKTISKPMTVVVQSLKKKNNIQKPPTIVKNKPSSKIEVKAIAEIMLRPLTVVSNTDLQKTFKSDLRGLH